MKLITKLSLASIVVASSTIAVASEARSEKHAVRSTELRQSVFSLLGANMGPLGAMAKGKMAFDAKAVEKHATRINQLSLMIDDHTKTDTSKFEVKTEALNEMWTDRSSFEKRTNDLTLASLALKNVAATGDEMNIKKAIGRVGKTCGGCHDDFKKD